MSEDEREWKKKGEKIIANAWRSAEVTWEIREISRKLQVKLLLELFLTS